MVSVSRPGRMFGHSWGPLLLHISDIGRRCAACYQTPVAPHFRLAATKQPGNKIYFQYTENIREKRISF